MTQWPVSPSKTPFSDVPEYTSDHHTELWKHLEELRAAGRSLEADGARRHQLRIKQIETAYPVNEFSLDPELQLSGLGSGRWLIESEIHYRTSTGITDVDLLATFTGIPGVTSLTAMGAALNAASNEATQAKFLRAPSGYMSFGGVPGQHLVARMTATGVAVGGAAWSCGVMISKTGNFYIYVLPGSWLRATRADG